MLSKEVLFLNIPHYMKGYTDSAGYLFGQISCIQFLRLYYYDIERTIACWNWSGPERRICCIWYPFQD